MSTYVAQSFVLHRRGQVTVEDEIGEGHDGVVRLGDDVGCFGGRKHRKGEVDLVRILVGETFDEEGSHAGAGTAAQGVHDLESLQRFALLRGDQGKID